jgi:hypothetical protein
MSLAQEEKKIRKRENYLARMLLLSAKVGLADRQKVKKFCKDLDHSIDGLEDYMGRAMTVKKENLPSQVYRNEKIYYSAEEEDMPDSFNYIKLFKEASNDIDEIVNYLSDEELLEMNEEDLKDIEKEISLEEDEAEKELKAIRNRLRKLIKARKKLNKNLSAEDQRINTLDGALDEISSGELENAIQNLENEEADEIKEVFSLIYMALNIIKELIELLTDEESILLECINFVDKQHNEEFDLENLYEELENIENEDYQSNRGTEEANQTPKITELNELAHLAAITNNLSEETKQFEEKLTELKSEIEAA